MRNKIILGIVALALTVVGFAQPASAHHPVVTGTVQRECGASAPWSGHVKVESDADYNKNWQNKYQVDGGSYTAYSALVDDQNDFTFNVGPFPASKASVVVNVTSRWQNKANSEGVVVQSGSVTLNRPATTECPPPPCEDDEVGTPGNCEPECPYTPGIPEDSDDCNPPPPPCPPGTTQHDDVCLIPPVVIVRPPAATPVPTAPTFTG